MPSKLIPLTLGVASVLALASCGSSTSPYSGGGGGGGCTPTATKVCLNALSFSPTNLTVTAGTTVMWQNGSVATHTVTSDAGSAQTYDSGNIGPAGTFSQTFNTAGTYNYHCTYHVANGMTGTITVQP